MLTLQLFDGKTGAHIQRLSMVKVSWSDAINEAGSLNAVSSDWRGLEFRPYGQILAITEGNDIHHAGYLTRAKYSQKDCSWELDAGGFMTILEKRLVLNHALASSWKDGMVVVDEDHPKGNWPLKYTGTYSDIISRHLRETLKWGELPVLPLALSGSKAHELSYNSYDLATIAQRIEDIGALDNGPEFRFDPHIRSDGRIEFQQVTSSDNGEIVNNTWQWNTTIPNAGVVLGDSDYDGSDIMCTQSYGTGGRDEDKLLVARSVSSKLTSAGWPVLQVANKEHSTVSKLNTLKSYVNADTRSGDEPQAVHALQVDRTRYRVRVGDWANVRYGTGPNDVLEFKITDVSGSTESTMLDVQARERS